MTSRCYNLAVMRFDIPFIVFIYIFIFPLPTNQHVKLFNTCMPTLFLFFFSFFFIFTIIIVVANVVILILILINPIDKKCDFVHAVGVQYNV